MESQNIAQEMIKNYLVASIRSFKLAMLLALDCFLRIILKHTTILVWHKANFGRLERY